MLDNQPRGTICIEDIEIGMIRTLTKEVTDRDIALFAEVSTDRNPVHLDEDYAQETRFGGRIAHGMLVLAIASGLSTRLPLMKLLEPSILGLANLECRFTKPVKIGDTIHVVLEIAEKTPGRKPDRGTVAMKRTAVNQRGETVMESTWKIVVRTRGSAQ